MINPQQFKGLWVLGDNEMVPQLIKQRTNPELIW